MEDIPSGGQPEVVANEIGQIMVSFQGKAEPLSLRARWLPKVKIGDGKQASRKIS